MYNNLIGMKCKFDKCEIRGLIDNYINFSLDKIYTTEPTHLIIGSYSIAAFCKIKHDLLDYAKVEFTEEAVIAYLKRYIDSFKRDEHGSMYAKDAYSIIYDAIEWSK